MTEQHGLTIFDVVGEAGFARLVASFYSRVPEDPILGPMYPPEDLPGAEQRLRDFLVYRFGGPQRYIQQRGHPRLRMRHAPFPINPAARDRWLEVMESAFRDAQLHPEAERLLRDFFAQTSTFLINRE